jgi:SAM-dependent methyltransferase
VLGEAASDDHCRISPGAACFRAALKTLGFSNWFRTAAADAFIKDPWVAFDRAQQAQKPSGHLGAIIDLFVRGADVTRLEVEGAIGSAALAWLAECGIVGESRGCIRSRLCLIADFEQFLLADWPFRTLSGRLISQRTYLSSGSYDCALAIIKVGKALRGLDLGCGSGILTSLLTAWCVETDGVDADPRAIWLSAINVSLNGGQANFIHRNWNELSTAGQVYDTIVANPPWRLVPEDVHYPDPHLRVGRGVDGLNAVRKVISIAGALLTPGGTAIVRFDLPHSSGRAHPLRASVDALTASGVDTEYVSLGRVEVSEQAATSANTCAHLNPHLPDLVDRFREMYAQKKINWLEPNLCLLRRRPAHLGAGAT